MLPSNAHRKIRGIFPNGIRRTDIETVIYLVLEDNLGKACRVQEFVAAARALGCAATENQIANVAYQMSEVGELQRFTIGGNFHYLHWADPVDFRILTGTK